MWKCHNCCASILLHDAFRAVSFSGTMRSLRITVQKKSPLAATQAFRLRAHALPIFSNIAGRKCPTLRGKGSATAASMSTATLQAPWAANLPQLSCALIWRLLRSCETWKICCLSKVFCQGRHCSSKIAPKLNMLMMLLSPPSPYYNSLEKKVPEMPNAQGESGTRACGPP